MHSRNDSRAAFLIALLAAACVPILAGCAYRVTPPADVQDPVTLAVVDYGGSSRLRFPLDPAPAAGGVSASADPAWAEYGYGEWAWYAENRESLARGALALGWPTRGTLGRRFGTGPIDAVVPGETVEAAYLFEAERAGAAALQSRLDAAFAGQTPVYNPERGLDFVPTQDRYWAGNQSTSRVALWLEQLGCRVSGFSIAANYRFYPPGSERPIEAERRRGATDDPVSAR